MDRPPSRRSGPRGGAGPLTPNGERLAAPYITSLERLARERGAQEGFGLGQVTLLRSLLNYRFGPLPDWVEVRLSGSTPDELTAWSHDVLDAADLEGVFGR